MSFNAKEVKDKCVEWIREWFKENGNQCKAVIGISGGVDSSVVAALCVEALGKERVYGVLMPQNSQDDIDYSYELCEHLGIDTKTKTLLFSDSLDFERADKICRHFSKKAKVAFGIGTYLSNDTCVSPLNIVMKTTKCNGQDVAKISDVEGKTNY